MADKKVTAADEAPKKHVLSMTDENGKYNPPSMMDLNRDALNLKAAARKRRDAIVRRVTEYVDQELKKA